MKINIGKIKAQIVQIGESNTYNNSFISQYKEELIQLINNHATLEEKLNLTQSVKSIEDNDVNRKTSAMKLLSFIKDISKDIVSSAIVFGLEQLANQ